MLVRKRNEDSHSVSPFLYEGLAQTPQSTKQHQQPEQLPPLPENNRGRTFRQIGRAHV